MSPEFKQRLEEVIRCLLNFQGEEIKAGDHPLHKAIVRLEAMCRMRPFMHGRKQDKLFQPECNIWFACLWASRPNNRRIPLRCYDLSENKLLLNLSPRHTTKDPDPDLSRAWAKILLNRLQRYRDPDYLKKIRDEQWNGPLLSSRIPDRIQLLKTQKNRWRREEEQ